MSDKKKLWDRRFLQLAKLVSTWSKDPSTKVGAVVVRDKNKFVSLGYNGYPSGLTDSVKDDPRELKYLKTIHAELNAILSSNESLEGCTLYVYPLPPCPNCLSAIIQKKFHRVVAMVNSKDAVERWNEKLKVSEQMLADYGKIELEYYHGWFS